MPYCPKCGSDVGNAMFCPNCGAKQGERNDQFSSDPSYRPSEFDRQQPPPYQPPVRRGSGIVYDEMICCVLCCLGTPLIALLYYIFSEHPEKYPDQRY